MLYEKLDYVIAIAEEQNLTRAAKKLYISQPTLTMYLNRLEESLGVQLFDRKKNPVLLTPAGKHYIEKMREIAEAEQILRGELRTVSDPARTFRIGSARVRGHYWLPPLLRLLSDRHPDLNFSVTLGRCCGCCQNDIRKPALQSLSVRKSSFRSCWGRIPSTWRSVHWPTFRKAIFRLSTRI